MSVDVEVRVAERDKVRQVAASLAKAVYDDPVCSFAFPSDTTRLRRLSRLRDASSGSMEAARDPHRRRLRQSDIAVGQVATLRERAVELPCGDVLVVNTFFRTRSASSMVRTPAWVATCCRAGGRR